MLYEDIAPLEVKLLNPNPAGCWHCVAAMIQGFDELCGPAVLPAIGPVKVSEIAEAACGKATASINAKVITKLNLLMFTCASIA